VPPLLIYTVFRRYLQAMDLVRPILAAVVVANVVNALANVVLIYGAFEWPGFGAVGSAYATLLARLCLMAFLGVVVLSRERARPSGLHDVSWAVDVPRMWRLVRLGFPSASQLALEVGIFAAASALAAKISPTAVASNQIVLNIASFFFMVPLGLSSAAAVRVGQAVGRGDAAAARLAGWTALLLSLVGASITAALFVTIPGALLRIFTDNPAVLALGGTLLLLCAVFQPFDSLQVVTTGVLRGVGDTRTPMLCNLAGHWLIGLPVAYTLCFAWGWGVVGLWGGLTLGLMLVGAALVWTWHRSSQRDWRMVVAGPVSAEGDL
jgi:MATE family multidrug resistance protein